MAIGIARVKEANFTNHKISKNPRNHNLAIEVKLQTQQPLQFNRWKKTIELKPQTISGIDNLKEMFYLRYEAQAISAVFQTGRHQSTKNAGVCTATTAWQNLWTKFGILGGGAREATG